MHVLDLFVLVFVGKVLVKVSRLVEVLLRPLLGHLHLFFKKGLPSLYWDVYILSVGHILQVQFILRLASSHFSFSEDVRRLWRVFWFALCHLTLVLEDYIRKAWNLLE